MKGELKLHIFENQKYNVSIKKKKKRIKIMNLEEGASALYCQPKTIVIFTFNTMPNACVEKKKFKQYIVCK